MNLEHGGNIYAIAEARGWRWQDVLDFSASINPLGPSPFVEQAIRDAIPRIVHYPDRHASNLIRRLADAWGVHPDRILTGNGATELIHFVARVWREKRVALRVPTFSEFHRVFPAATLLDLSIRQASMSRSSAMNATEIRYRAAPEGSGQSPDKSAGFDLIIATNPNNPTGQTLEAEANFIDESFIEFTSLPTAMHRQNTFVLRSLTKFQALPGLRVGALIGPPEAIQELRSHREPWQVNVLAEAAAIAALDDSNHAHSTREYVKNERERLWPLLSALPGVHPLPTEANFYFAQLDYSASNLCSHLLDHKILIRNCTGVPGIKGEAVRLAIRRQEDNDRLLAVWSAYQP